jgi:hypothetical protein
MDLQVDQEKDQEKQALGLGPCSPCLALLVEGAQPEPVRALEQAAGQL